MDTARQELLYGMRSMLDRQPVHSTGLDDGPGLVLGTLEQLPQGERNGPDLKEEGYWIKTETRPARRIVLVGKTDKGVLYAVFHLLRIMQNPTPFQELDLVEHPKNPLRMINQWDNADGSIERGYAGQSIFYKDHQITADVNRVRDYARLLASVGINAISINNVNVHEDETRFITREKLPDVARVADVFRAYGIRLFLSVNFASPMQIGSVSTADPLDRDVQTWWREKAKEIYRQIPDFGGFLVKADSERRPGPFTYNRDHADGANMLARALKPFGGLVIWRCFVYDCLQDWRDRTTDRAKAAYDHFKPLDRTFEDTVILQIKNGPMDFQVREPVSPLLGAMAGTNQMMELQITQEYTGQQRHLCYLVPQWKHVLDFDTHARGKGSYVKKVTAGSLFSYAYSGIAAVSNIGDDDNWTGHPLAQANLYGYGRLAWNPDLSAETITEEWVRQTFGHDPLVVETIGRMLSDSWEVYERYTAPLGVGWMVNPGHHYGPNVDGYEYTPWGTYHFADWAGIGVDRTEKTGTGYTAQYFPENRRVYESLATCPDEVLLFFHHVPYTHKLKSGKTVIQHIYDTHFEGVDRVKDFIDRWKSLKPRMDRERYHDVLARLEEQHAHAQEWRDVINTYFYRKSGIRDQKDRTIY